MTTQSNKPLNEALEAFRTQYPTVTSGDLQAFVLGWQAAEKHYKSIQNGKTNSNGTSK